MPLVDFRRSLRHDRLKIFPLRQVDGRQIGSFAGGRRYPSRESGEEKRRAEEKRNEMSWFHRNRLLVERERISGIFYIEAILVSFFPLANMTFKMRKEPLIGVSNDENRTRFSSSFSHV